MCARLQPAVSWQMRACGAAGEGACPTALLLCTAGSSSGCVRRRPPEATCRISSNSASSCLCRPDVSTMIRSLHEGGAAWQEGTTR